MTRLARTLLHCCVLVSVAGATPVAGFTPVAGPRTWSFPRDHGAHPGFQTEWWYWTGHLEAAGHRYGYEIVFFRRAPDQPTDLGHGFAGWKPAEFFPAHVALTDIDAGSFHHEQRIRRDIGGMAGSDSTDLRVWCGDWRAERRGEAFILTAGSDDWRLDLEMTPDKPPVRHGEDGLSRKGPLDGQASYYYSLPRLTTQGSLTRGERTTPVTGQSWMDHEFFSSDLDTTLAGWDWFSLQLDDRSELMLYRLRSRSGPASDWISGTWIDADGDTRPLRREEIVIEATGSWTSPSTGTTYPAQWTIQVPPIDLSLTARPTVAAQELDTTGSTGVLYWEGSIEIAGQRAGRTLRGVGYAELTGYDGRTPMRGSSR
ncbi:MAG: lipocalin-like domain-containing protein [Candidatus Eisenbacteria bacterium]|nr:lipocalin-like domain-containing protein [Candidatus Eisenbacteria bacterium]